MKNRNGTIDFMKFICSIGIVIFHSRNFINRSNRIFINGAVLVEFFFLVSGFLMVASLEKYKEQNEINVGKTTVGYIGHKIKGLCPEYYVAMLIGFVVLHVFGKGRHVGEDLLSSVWEISFLQISGLTGYHSNAATWYISAMLLSMLILVPLCIKNRNLFLYVIAPAIGIFGLGILYQNCGFLSGPENWQGNYMKGFLRGISELSLGAFAFLLVEKVRKREYTTFGKTLLSLLECGCYILVFIGCATYARGTGDFVIVFFQFFGVVLSFSHKGILSPAFDHSFVYFLGKISYPIFLGHIYWSHCIRSICKGGSDEEKYIIYFLLSATTAAAIYIVSQGLRNILPKVKENWKKIFFAS